MDRRHVGAARLPRRHAPLPEVRMGAGAAAPGGVVAGEMTGGLYRQADSGGYTETPSLAEGGIEGRVSWERTACAVQMLLMPGRHLSDLW